MQTKDMINLKEQLNKSNSSLIFRSIVLLTVLLAVYLVDKAFFLPSWLTLVVYTPHWILSFLVISSLIKVIKIDRTIKKLK
ncbi:hypothetical protein [Bacillus pseudomycoides]|uniref:2TM domain-containing protein n=1 Tax=Bacillus pseudomycoides TaxID=64104 RepID=A0ABD6TCX2_9BACI|nr:hypothetical protein [Bacillus pseudomycoides]KFN12836.1 putative membrane protein [Bacillus pseudomycoides]MDR4188061.1 hypothetical protein [Bacillus pseudomycoides]MED0855679.1 hypothetical protein [Bacillus pseudomycoides]PFZ93656.1 hypothetical protein COL70_08530 [Bacillus pseudomycoides]PHF04240.1 hypothetical protein COF81_02170 [Bacillus pseudomycoides]